MRLKELRKINKLTQEQISKVISVAPSTYRGYESETSEPSIDTLIKLADYYNVTLDYLLGRNFSSFENTELAQLYVQLDSTNKGKVVGYAKSCLENQKRY